MIFIILTWFAIKSERLDLYCPGQIQCYDYEKCRTGNGKYYINERGKSTDNIKTLLDKIVNLGDIDIKTVKWRRCFIVSLIVLILIYLIVYTRIPSAKELCSVFAIMFFISYASFSYYSFHYYQFPSKFIAENVKLLKSKLNQKFKSKQPQVSDTMK